MPEVFSGNGTRGAVSQKDGQGDMPIPIRALHLEQPALEVHVAPLQREHLPHAQARVTTEQHDELLHWAELYSRGSVRRSPPRLFGTPGRGTDELHELRPPGLGHGTYLYVTHPSARPLQEAGWIRQLGAVSEREPDVAPLRRNEEEEHLRALTGRIADGPVIDEFVKLRDVRASRRAKGSDD
jgi:hypothetical protein